MAAVCCDYNAWPAIGFHQPSGDDTEHAGVPALAGHNQHAVEAALWVFIELTLHLPENFSLRFLPQGICLADLLREGGGLFLLLAEQKV